MAVAVQHIVVNIVVQVNLALVFLRLRADKIAVPTLHQTRSHSAEQPQRSADRLWNAVHREQPKTSMIRFPRRKYFIQTVIDREIRNSLQRLFIFQKIFKQPCRFITGIVAQIPLPDVAAALIHQNRQCTKPSLLQQTFYLLPAVPQKIRVAAHNHIGALVVLDQIHFLLFLSIEHRAKRAECKNFRHAFLFLHSFDKGFEMFLRSKAKRKTCYKIRAHTFHLIIRCFPRFKERISFITHDRVSADPRVENPAPHLVDSIPLL